MVERRALRLTTARRLRTAATDHVRRGFRDPTPPPKPLALAPPPKGLAARSQWLREQGKVRLKAELDRRWLTDFRTVVGTAGTSRGMFVSGVALEGTTIELVGGVARFPMEATAASRALMERYAAAARESGLSASEAPLIGGGSDASTSSAMGIASIDGLGPRGRGFHTHDEHIELATLIPKTEALVRFLVGAA